MNWNDEEDDRDLDSNQRVWALTILILARLSANARHPDMPRKPLPTFPGKGDPSAAKKRR